MLVPRRLGFLVLAALLATVTVPLAQTRTETIAPDSYKSLKFRYIGPVGNRVIAVAGVPADPNVYYVGAASGGIFKTTDNTVPTGNRFSTARRCRRSDPWPSRPRIPTSFG
jgi:hypothetical protein